MFQDKYVFAQLTAFLNRTQFNNYVRKYDGNRYVKHFTCWNQLLAMMFGQLSNRESLRDLIVALEAHRAKQYHLGLGRNTIVKATLAYANQTRDYRIFEDFAFYMMKEACEKRETNILNIPGKKYAFDSTTIPLCLATFPWAKFRSKKGGVKAHVLYDIEAQVPAFYTVTTASKHDSTAMSSIPYEPNSYYIFDRAYDTFKELYKIHLTGSYYVVRAKTNLKYKTVKWKRRMPKNVLTDAEVKLTGDARNCNGRAIAETELIAQEPSAMRFILKLPVSSKKLSAIIFKGWSGQYLRNAKTISLRFICMIGKPPIQRPHYLSAG